MPRIYLDFDDVLCETARCLSDLLAAQFGKQVSYEEIRWFDLGRSFGLAADELSRFFDVVHQAEVIRGMQPAPGAYEALSRWHARGCEICVVTGRPPETMPASRDWLAAHAMPYDHLFFVDKYGRHAPGPDLLTLEELAGMEFALAVEDAPAMLEFLVNEMPVPVLIYDRPWNAGFRADGAPPGRMVRRCASWAEIEEQAREILGWEDGMA